MFKKILIFLLFVFIVIQFFHPKPNKSAAEQKAFIGRTYVIPGDVNPYLKKPAMTAIPTIPGIPGTAIFNRWTGGSIII